MDISYFSGWALALTLGLVKLVISYSVSGSLRVANLKKIGLHYHPFSGQFKDSPASKSQWVFCAFYLLIIAPIFSWISVISGVWQILSVWSKKAELPEKIKEINYKVSNINLSKEEVLNLQRETSAFYETTSETKPMLDTSEPDLNKRDRDDTVKNYLDVGDGEWSAVYKIHPQMKILKYNANTPDYDSVYNSVLEYKFEGNKVYTRSIEDSVDNYGKVTFHIKDNVVLESSLRKICQDNKFKNFEEELKKYNAQVEWSLTEFHELRFFTMSFHPEEFPVNELRKIARQELERISLGRERFTQKAVELGCIIVEEKLYTRFQLPENCDEVSKTKIEALFSNHSVSEYNISRRELDSALQIIAYLTAFLGEKRVAA